MSKEDLSQTLKAGTLLTIEHGCYSDKDWSGPFRVLRDFTKQEAVDDFQAQWKPEYKGQTYVSAYHFAPFLVRAGYVEAVDVAHNWHVGDYEFEP